MSSYVNDFTPTVKAYYNALRPTKPLSKAEEKVLIKRAKNNDVDAQNKIISANLKFVFSVAKRYKGCGADLEDLISEGNLGLIKAIDRFDESKDVKFFTYAVWWIRQSIQEYLTNVNKKNDMENKIGDNHDTRQEEAYSDDDGDEQCQSSYTQIVEETVVNNEAYYKQIISDLLTKIPPRGRDIMEKYYGLNDADPMTLEEIGKELHITKERVRQIKESCLKIIRTEVMVSEYDYEEIFS